MISPLVAPEILKILSDVEVVISKIALVCPVPNDTRVIVNCFWSPMINFSQVLQPIL